MSSRNRDAALAFTSPMRRSRSFSLLVTCLMGLIMMCVSPLQISFLAGPVAPAENGIQVSRRLAAASALPLFFAPEAALARRRGVIETRKEQPNEVQQDGDQETWEPINIGESTEVDPDDPKYEAMRQQALLNEFEKQKKRNDDYSSMSPEEKAEKMCNLLGRGCANVGSVREMKEAEEDYAESVFD
eukprot:TRINITY_DN10147_c0_g2_i2.p1 TRINITY_DN10147_c0_g2~~TRINITY_DN10147_c0_g2_i2.p1  ORF type:complete len:197 (-),score=47.06 TRINITY_DN10147_c0_g2_i2:190-750(-)